MESLSPLTQLGTLALAIVVALFGYVFVLPWLEHLLWRVKAVVRMVRHPRPLSSWVRAALAPLDRGGLWLDEHPLSARYVLRTSWSITCAKHWAREMSILIEGDRPMGAWDGLRAIRITLQASCAGWIPERDAWEISAVIAEELQRSHESFGELAHAYEQAFLAWATPQMDPRAIAGESRRRNRSIAWLESLGWCGVRFHRNVVARDARVRDRPSLRSLVELLGQRY